MAMKPKSARRLLLLGVLAFVVIASGIAFVGVRKWQNSRRDMTLRAEGMAAFDRMDYFGTLNSLGRYDRRHPADADVLLTLAKARENVDDPDGAHFAKAAKLYERYLELKPDDTPSARKLVDLYMKFGLWNEARDRAARLRPSNLAQAQAEHRELLLHEARARSNIKASDPKVGELLERALALDPVDVLSQAHYTKWLREVGRAADATAYVERLRQAHGSEPWARLTIEIIAVDGRANAGGNAALAAACELANINLTTAERLGPSRHGTAITPAQLALFFDAASSFNHSITVMKEEVKTNPESELRPILVRRLWQAGMSDDALSWIPEKLDLRPNGSHTELLVFKVLASRDRKIELNATEIQTAMAARVDDFRSMSWLPLIKSIDQSPPPAPADHVVLLLEAIKVNPREPIFQTWLGNRYAELGRDEEAREAWRKSTEPSLATGWATPWIRIANSYLQTGRYELALEAATNAKRLAPTGTEATIAWINAQVGCIESNIPIPLGEAALLDLVQRVVSQNNADQNPGLQHFVHSLLPARVLLMARGGFDSDAKRLVREALGATPPPPRNVIQQLTSISARRQLGLDEDLAAFADKTYGADPQSALNRALSLHGQGQTEQAVTLLKDAVTKSGTNSDSWRLALAKFYDSIRDPRAKEEWISLVDSRPDSRSIQTEALRSPSVGEDPALLGRVADRVVTLGGGDLKSAPAIVRLAKARAVIGSRPSKLARDEMIALLRTLATEAPDLTDARRLLVQAFLLDDPERGLQPDVSAAVDQLRGLAATNADRSGPLLDIALLYQSQREFGKAKAELLKVGGDAAMPVAARAQAAEMLITQGEFNDARPILEQMVRESGANADPVQVLRLAGVYRSGMRDADALTLYRALVRTPLTDPQLVFQLADGLASLGDEPNGVVVLDSLDKLDMPAARRDIMKGSFFQRRGKTAQATEAFERAVSVAPADADAWSTLVNFYVASGQRPKAVEATQRGLAKIPNNPKLTVLQQQFGAEGSNQPMNLRAIAENLAKDPANKERADAVRTLADLQDAGKLEDPDAWEQIADRFPNDATIQSSAAQSLASLNPPRLEQAAAIARRAMVRFPTTPEPARTASFVYRQMSNWGEMLVAAKQWQQLTRSRDSDIAVAEASLNIQQPKTSIEQLRSYVSSALAVPGEMWAQNVLSITAAAMVQANQSRDAFNMLSPSLKSSSDVRNKIFLPVAGGTELSETDTKQWLDAAVAASDPASIDDQMAIADACARISARMPRLRVQYLERCVDILKRLEALPASAKAERAVSIAYGLGAAHERAGNLSAAIEAYRRAVALQPKSALLTDALARAIATDAVAKGADPSEAVELSRKANELAGAGSDSLERTLARCYEALGKFRQTNGDPAGANAAWSEASQIYRKLCAIASPAISDFYLLAQLQETVGQYRDAIATYERALTLPTPISRADRAGIENNLAYMLYKSEKTPAVLNRAREHAVSATQAVELAAFLDTLGAIEFARGEPAAAVAAYRRALAAEPLNPSCLIGLATALAAGDAKQQTEAKTVLGPILEGKITLPPTEPELTQRLNDVRKKIGI